MRAFNFVELLKSFRRSSISGEEDGAASELSISFASARAIPILVSLTRFRFTISRSSLVL